MPFEYFGDDSSKAWLASGLSEEIIHSLANVRELRVAARTSSFAFRAGTVTVPEIARKLNVAAVLEGSVRMNGNDIRVTAQLIDAGTGLHVWSHVFDRDVEALFAVQDEIARNVTESLVGTSTASGSAGYVSRSRRHRVSKRTRCIWMRCRSGASAARKHTAAPWICCGRLSISTRRLPVRIPSSPTSTTR